MLNPDLHNAVPTAHPAHAFFPRPRTSPRTLMRTLVLGIFCALTGLAQALGGCKSGFFTHAMLRSYHIGPPPDSPLLESNPGLGVECWRTPQWAGALGEFRNSLDRPSWYGGAIYGPSWANWGWMRITAMGGLISGYNYGSIGFGTDHNIGPILTLVAMFYAGPVGANVILIPPIAASNLPLTLGFQAKVGF